MIARNSMAPHGFALAESLVALTLLSLGLASVVGVLVQCLRGEREAATRTAALRMAASLGEELRALRPPDGRALLAVTGVPASLACAGRADSCAAEAAAATVIAAWHAELAVQGPAGAHGAVEVADPDVPSYRIAVRWPATGAGDDVVLRLIVEA